MFYFLQKWPLRATWDLTSHSFLFLQRSILITLFPPQLNILPLYSWTILKYWMVTMAMNLILHMHVMHFLPWNHKGLHACSSYPVHPDDIKHKITTKLTQLSDVFKKNYQYGWWCSSPKWHLSPVIRVSHLKFKGRISLLTTRPYSEAMCEPQHKSWRKLKKQKQTLLFQFVNFCDTNSMSKSCFK